jgi:YesN/AraC family two-component response regulator
MGIPVVLWIRLSGSADSSQLISQLSGRCELHTVDKVDDIPHSIDRHEPQLICFDFDYPDLAGLTALSEVKHHFPSIPVLMLTEPNSEALAVWALRTRVWDYFTKPVDADEFLSRVEILARLSNKEDNDGRQIALPEESIPVQIRVGGHSAKHSTHAAISYIDNHFHEKVSLSKVAENCGMEATSFSRAFKNENGSTFREYLLRYRVKKAAELLRHTDAGVLEIACAVGFNDPSQFTRMFKRYFGATPSGFRAGNSSLTRQLEGHSPGR